MRSCFRHVAGAGPPAWQAGLVALQVAGGELRAGKAALQATLLEQQADLLGLLVEGLAEESVLEADLQGLEGPYLLQWWPPGPRAWSSLQRSLPIAWKGPQAAAPTNG